MLQVAVSFILAKRYVLNIHMQSQRYCKMSGILNQNTTCIHKHTSTQWLAFLLTFKSH